MIRPTVLAFAAILTCSVRLSVAADFDLDGIPDASDNAPSHYNPSQSNLDADAFGDAMDTDLDGDGVPNLSDDAPEHFNSDQTDSDGDGIGDVAEIAYGMHPLDPNDRNLNGPYAVLAPLTTYNPLTQPGLLVDTSGSGYFNHGGGPQRGDYIALSFDLNNDNVFDDATGFGVGPSGDTFFLSPTALHAAGIDQPGDHTIQLRALWGSYPWGFTSATIQTVPEPSSLLLLGIAGLTLSHGRRRHW